MSTMVSSKTVHFVRKQTLLIFSIKNTSGVFVFSLRPLEEMSRDLCGG